MLVKFTGQSMAAYRGSDGHGKLIDLKKGDQADVSDSVGKLLLQRYRNDFQEVKEIAPAAEEPSKSDKKQRKTSSYCSK